MSLVARRNAGLIRPPLLLLLAALALPAQAAQPLQAWLDAAPAGTVLRLLPGTYSGPAVLEKPLTLEGNGEVTIDGGGHGTVLVVRTSDAVVRGLRIVGSGESHDAIDSGIVIEGQRNRIENNVVEDVLFGIVLHQANDNLVAGNRIRSKPWDIADRGDGLRLWYSMGNRIERNDIAQIRDVTISNSPRNRYVGNTIRDSRRAMNFLFSHDSFVENNHLSNNATGLTILHSGEMIIRRNHIAHAMGASGAGIAIKESGSMLIEDNEILHCAVGLIADSPLAPDNLIRIVGNRFSHNVTGISFYGERIGHLVKANRFTHNLWQATVGGGDENDRNVWQGNYWDDYQGFDRNADGIGDTPHEILAYADRIWMETPMARFFRNSPVLEMLDFLERLAPFSEPVRILHDPQPVAHARKR